MDRRSFSLWAAAAARSGCGGSDESDGAVVDDDARPGSGTSVVKHVAEPNPTGLRWGFWEVYTQQAATLAAVGRRPSARVSFDGWAAIEQRPGLYTWPDPARYGDTHLHGETILGAVNVSFKVPAHYADDITDATTREAARNFVRAYVQWLLGNFGSAVLTIDYEIVSNYRLQQPGSEPRAQEWAAWYLEAAAAAREAAAELGKSALLALQPIFNGDPFLADSPIAKGGAHNPWLREVVAASDYLALDTYHRDVTRPLTDANRTLEIIRFWIDEFAGDREVVVTENGFCTAADGAPGVPLDPRKYKGTEAEQAGYYADLFPKLLAANQPSGVFRNRLRGFHVWSITDNPKADDLDDRHFGLVTAEGREKPAAPIVRAAIARAEADPFHRPYNTAAVDGRNLADRLASGSEAVSLSFTEGDRFEFLRWQGTGPQSATEVRLQVAFATLGNLLVKVNGHWQLEQNRSAFDIDISAHYRPGGPNVIDVHATARSFPVNQQVLSLRVVYA
jgi:hypothetical protein